MKCPSLVKNKHGGIKGPVIIAVMDGVGIGNGDEADAVANAHTPTLDYLSKEALVTRLTAHGRAIGMPGDDDMGNSEVGHNALGAGRIFDQGAKLVAQAVASGAIFDSKTWHTLVERGRRGAALHFIGLLSDGNVHSHIDHLAALLRRAAEEGVAKAYVHVLLDGRDVGKTSALLYVDKLETVLAELNTETRRNYRIASGGGRMFITMDRYEADWPMVERGYRTHVLAQGRSFNSAREAIETFRREAPGVGDQDLPPFVIYEGGAAVAPIRSGDCVVAFNFRGDRMLELTRVFEDNDFDKFSRGKRPDVYFAGMTLYDGDAQRPKNYLVAPPQIECTLGELLCDAQVTQLACSETQKFGHVTYFWNGNRTGAFNDQLERYIEVPSLAPPFDAHPEMRAKEIAAAVAAELENKSYGLVRVNFANGDMVGHTGNFSATVAAVEAVDQAIATLLQCAKKLNGALIVTADHGNAEDMAERDKKSGAIVRDALGKMVAKTSHSLNPVPCYIHLPNEERGRFALQAVENPGLGNMAATLALLLGFEPPAVFLPSLLHVLS